MSKSARSASNSKLLTWLTTNQPIALIAIQAVAIGRVIGIDTNRILGTRIMHVARVLATLIDTRFRNAAIRVVGTFNCG